MVLPSGDQILACPSHEPVASRVPSFYRKRVKS